jgi:hypothetical protein
MSKVAPPKPGRPSLPGRPRRLLFLDDDPARAEIFLAENPEAVWVQTAQECLARLAEPWDEVHLDHDLGGERYVDLSREDCGMEVVRWLCLEPRPHLVQTLFYIHSHNAGAASAMVMQMYMSGYKVESRPFGALPPPLDLAQKSWDQRSCLGNWLDRLRALLRHLAGYPELPPTPTAGRDRPGAEAEPPGSAP